MRLSLCGMGVVLSSTCVRTHAIANKHSNQGWHRRSQGCRVSRTRGTGGAIEHTLVSIPAASTTPITHAVCRNWVPRSSKLLTLKDER